MKFVVSIAERGAARVEEERSVSRIVGAIKRFASGSYKSIDRQQYIRWPDALLYRGGLVVKVNPDRISPPHRKFVLGPALDSRGRPEQVNNYKNIDCVDVVAVELDGLRWTRSREIQERGKEWGLNQNTLHKVCFRFVRNTNFAARTVWTRE